MAGLNLLPWREEAREKQKKQYFAALGVAAVIGALGVLAANTFINTRIDYQKARNSYLESEIAMLNHSIKKIKTLDETKQALLDRMKIIETLQSTRPAIVHLFDEMATALPEGMFLERLQQSGTNVKLQGKSESNARVSAYMKQLDNSEWLSSSDLNIIVADKSVDNPKSVVLRNFDLQVKQLLTQGSKQEDKHESASAE